MEEGDYIPTATLVKAVDYISIATLSGKRGRLYIYRYTVWWKREIICLSLHWWKREIIIIPIATLGLYTYCYTVWWKREIIYLSLHCLVEEGDYIPIAILSPPE